MIWLACDRLGLTPPDQKVGIIGRGNVGSRLQKLLAVLGISCVANDPPLADSGISGLVSLDEALEALDADRAFLRAGDVFSDDLIDAYIELKNENVARLRMTTHPVEFDMYYSL